MSLHRADQDYIIKTATLSLHITQLAVPILASTKILFFSFFIKHPTISIFFLSSHLKSTTLQDSLNVNHLVLVLSNHPAYALKSA